MHGNPEVVKIILAHGGDTTVRQRVLTRRGERPIYVVDPELEALPMQVGPLLILVMAHRTTV